VSDIATPNLPSRDFERTFQFYKALGFQRTWRDSGWMILKNGTLLIEFFICPELNPSMSSYSCCFRLKDVDRFYRSLVEVGVPEATSGWPRVHRPKLQAWGGKVGALIDIDGSLIRLIQSDDGDA
jgi:catechol 2,3-dioxygenase-like lactoylglutathione lyase family enzyme